MLRFLPFVLWLTLSSLYAQAEESFSQSCFDGSEAFVLIHGKTGESLYAKGEALDERVSPYSTFKIALSLIGYDVGIIKDLETPVWSFQEGYEDDFPAWKIPQSPLFWIKNSCVWYSKILSLQIGQELLQNYLTSFEYGNQDLSAGLSNPGSPPTVWIDSSLKISPKEQTLFLQKMIQGDLPVSQYAVQMTKALLFREERSDGWRLYGKLGGGDSADGLEYGWFVGWIEKKSLFFPFAYLICDKKINYAQRTSKANEYLNAFLSDTNHQYRRLE